MSDKSRRRIKKKLKRIAKKKARNKDPHLNPLNIPEGVNVYEASVLAVGREDVDPADGALCALHVKIVEETMEHFDVPAEKRSMTGDMLLRFAMLMAEQNEGRAFRMPKELDSLTAMYHHMNKLMGELQTEA